MNRTKALAVVMLMLISSLAGCTGDDGPAAVPGCTSPGASNYDENATRDDGSCDYDLNGDKPEDRYSCVINSAGYCIFTGSPHQTGLQPGTSNVVDRNENFLFLINQSVAANSAGVILEARGIPAFDGDDLIEYSQDNLSEDEKAFHKVMAIMYPIRNALMYDIGNTSQEEWDQLIEELTIRNIKDTTYTDGDTPKDNYYGRQGVFDLAKNPAGKDIHHDVMKFLEESGLYLLCHATSDDFSQMLKETHPEGHDPCGDAQITTTAAISQ